MKEIKFKAWNKFKNKLSIVSKIDFISSQLWVLKNTGEEVKTPWQFSDIETMQYTGLKDKNGVEIFEGDVINFYQGLRHKDVNGTKIIGNVFWNEEELQFQIKLVEKIYKFNGFGLVDIEVIGNIYQNKNLIEKDF